MILKFLRCLLLLLSDSYGAYFIAINSIEIIVMTYYFYFPDEEQAAIYVELSHLARQRAIGAAGYYYNSTSTEEWQAMEVPSASEEGWWSQFYHVIEQASGGVITPRNMDDSARHEVDEKMTSLLMSIEAGGDHTADLRPTNLPAVLYAGMTSKMNDHFEKVCPFVKILIIY
jgi:hypothetical protein